MIKPLTLSQRLLERADASDEDCRTDDGDIMREADDALAKMADLSRLNDALDALWKEAEAAYIQALNCFSKTECLGWEAKTLTGVFGKAEYEAHKKANELIGRHHGMAHAVKTLRSALKEHANG